MLVKMSRPCFRGLEYRNDSNSSNYFNTPLFQEKKINYCIPSILTHTFEIIIVIAEHQHLAELEWGLLNFY